MFQAASCSDVKDQDDTNKRLLAATMKIQPADNKTFVANVANVRPSASTSLDPLQTCVLRHTANVSYKQLRVIRSSVKGGVKLAGEHSMKKTENSYKVYLSFIHYTPSNFANNINV